MKATFCCVVVFRFPPVKATRCCVTVLAGDTSEGNVLLRDSFAHATGKGDVLSRGCFAHAIGESSVLYLRTQLMRQRAVACLFLYGAGTAAARIKILEDKIKSLEQLKTLESSESALAALRRHISRPTAMFDKF